MQERPRRRNLLRRRGRVRFWTAGVPPQPSNRGLRTGRLAADRPLSEQSERRGGSRLNDVEYVEQNDDRDRDPQ